MKSNLLVVVLAAIVAASAGAEIPATMTYQGVITDAGGDPIADGDYAITFRLYDAASGGSLLWEENQSVTVSGGVFDAQLGSSTPLSLAFDAPYWLAISVEGGPEMTPRTPLTATAYSLGTRAIPDSAVTPEKISTGAAVRSLAGLTDDIVVRAEGGAVVTTSGDTLVINAGEGENTPVWNQNGNAIHYDAGNVGIGTGPDPIAALHVEEGQRVLFGADTTGPGIKLMWIPDRWAFRAGIILGDGGDLHFWDVDSLGKFSAAFNQSTRATGDASFAIGEFTQARGTASFAAGTQSRATGFASTALGTNTNASGEYAAAFGLQNDATGRAALAAGQDTEAEGDFSTALGLGTRTQYAATAVGRYNVGVGRQDAWIDTDAVFEVGIGTSLSDRENALTVYKNGYVGIGTESPISFFGVSPPTHPNAFWVKANGNVGIGTSAPVDALQVLGRVRIGNSETIRDAGASILHFQASLRPETDAVYALGTSSSRWSTVYAANGTINTSDARLKKNIQPIDYGLKQLMELRPVSFQWKDDEFGQTRLGLIAQDVQGVIDEVVVTEDVSMTEPEEGAAHGHLVRKKADYLGINYGELIPVLIKAIQDQQELIRTLEERVATLEGAGPQHEEARR